MPINTDQNSEIDSNDAKLIGIEYWTALREGVLTILRFTPAFSGIINLKTFFYSQHTFIPFVGGKLLNPTFLGSPTVRTVGVGVTFSLLLRKCLQQMSEKSDQHRWGSKIVVLGSGHYLRRGGGRCK